jgi:pyruvyl transferase EpsO
VNFEALLRDALLSLVRPGEQCVLLDYPNYPNVGDNAIWLGQIRILRLAGIRIVSIGDLSLDSWEEIAGAIGDRTILINGGGNFGDLWGRHQIFRERLCQEFPRNRIIQLPQSIHYKDDAKRLASQEVFRNHQDVHLMVRDRRSLEIAEGFAPGRAYLVPDAALCLPRKVRTRPDPRYDMLVLFRTDAESTRVEGVGMALPDGIFAKVTDWLDEEIGVWHQFYARLQKIDPDKRPWLRPAVNAMVSGSANRLAEVRFDRGIDLIQSARVVVTDRLHTVVLSWLCGVPVFFSDNTYGKLSGVLECWLKDESDIFRCDSQEEALQRAERWLRGPSA